MYVFIKNITTVASAKLCNTCGACFGVCPVEAIHYEETMGGYYLPVVDEAVCTRCEMCIGVCPGIHFGKTLLDGMPDDPFTGIAIEASVGKAADKKIFDNSQSGGIVSALLVHALESGRINGAVTVAMQPGSPPRPEVRIACTKQEILQAQKSKYCPIPLLCFIKKLKHQEGPVAVVGTSCQIHGLINVLDKLPNLQHKIAFTIGLVCDRVLAYSALDYLVGKASFKDHEIPRNFHFRDKFVSGYPGDVHVFSNNGKSVVMLAKSRIQVKDHFTPARCRLCFDKMNVYSDITVGDPHGLEGVDRTNGESMVAARTKPGLNVLRAARATGAINIRSAAYGQILKGQKIREKKEQWPGSVQAWQKIGRELPGFFDHVKDPGYKVERGRQYEKDLQSSLRLDEFESRDELFRFVDKVIRKKQFIKSLLSPLRLTKRIVGKIIK